jgi:WS/DGAT/MGAT family acyltransferase
MDGSTNPRPIHGGNRMSDVEALMWNLEKDPALASSFANVTILEHAPDVVRLRRRLALALEVIPRLHQRVMPGVGRFAPPEWRDDPDVDLEYHIRHIALPPPGTDRDLFDLAAVLAQVPFDRTRPLWEFTVIDGLAGGRAALLQKIHHTVTDGQGGVRMSAQFLDVTPDAPDPEPSPRVPPPIDAARDPSEDEPADNFITTAIETTTHNVRRGLGIARRAAGEGANLAMHPDRIPVIGIEAAATVQSVVRQAALSDTARSPLWTERSLHRRFEVLRVNLDDAKRASKSLGGGVNDFFVAGAAGAAGAYHRAKGIDVDELRISMPVSTRSDKSMGGNAFTPARALVPVGKDPVERFDAIRQRLGVTKEERALNLAGAMAGVMNLLPTSVVVRLARQQVHTVDFATSNVRGAPFDLYIAGAKIEANYPMGPVGGTAFNLTTLSSAGWLDMGLNIDTAAVDDPELLRVSLIDAYAELLAAGGAPF